MKRSWMSACRRMPYAGCNGSIPHPEVRRRSRSLEGRGLRAWGRVCRSPPLPTGISPTGGEIGQPNANQSIRSLRDGRELTTSRSPSLWGRCPAGQRGGERHPAWLPSSRHPTPSNLSTKNTSQPNQSLTQKPAKNPKIPPATFSMTRESPAQLLRSALGYTARRCGEAGPALVGERLRILFAIGVEQQSPRRHGRRATPVSDRPVSSSRCPTWPHHGCQD